MVFSVVFFYAAVVIVHGLGWRAGGFGLRPALHWLLAFFAMVNFVLFGP